MWQDREHHLVRSGHEVQSRHMAEQRERKRKAQQAEQKGKQSITHLFAAAAAKKQK